MGGIVAFEMAQRLTRADDAVGLLAMLDTPSPDDIKNITHAPTTDAEIKEYIRSLSPEISHELAKAESENGARFYDLWRTHCRAMMRYAPQPYLGDMLYFSASEKNAYFPHDFSCGWTPFITGDARIHPVPGNHLTMHLNPCVQQIAEGLNQWLFEAKISCLTPINVKENIASA